MTNWKYSHPHPNGTHHLDETGKPLYSHHFNWVLPFHEPGLAPVGDETGAYHIKPDGTPAYNQRFDRTFGFYQGRAAVIKKHRSFHILPDGIRLYEHNWAWCGNFQNNRCPVRDEQGNYYHIRPDGSKAPNGPWVYAGDYREGAAVVRGKDGLCRHIDPEGELIHNKAFFDLNVFHKGFAIARDAEGWFHIERDGNDISHRRYEYLEPFYNGQAYARLKDGSVVVINEDGEIKANIIISEQEKFQRLHDVALSYWIPFAIKLGLDAGLARGKPSIEIDERGKEAIRNAWISLGLLDEDTSILTPLGKQLELNTIIRARFDFWLGPQLKPWIDALASQEVKKGCDFFESLSSNQKIVSLTQRVLDSYAKFDWRGITHVIELKGSKTVVDLGGGKGALLKEIIQSPYVEKGILFERPEVTRIVDNQEKMKIVGGDIFSDILPVGDLYILSRVLHDWDDKKAIQILRNVAKSSGSEARLLIIDRISSNRGDYGLLDLNMYLITGGRERSLEDWKGLIKKTIWNLRKSEPFSDHFIMELEKVDSNV
ncbi:multifunctional cyclase-dehydratase-3-O-methyl transferase TcmN [archaeon]|nr:multifunctional cyclase-dehydratase-3-O-methyl transferase TcmN [archaeon]